MKNHPKMILSMLSTLVLLLIALGIFLWNTEHKNISNEIDKKELELSDEIIQNLHYPNMLDDCYFVNNMGRYEFSNLKFNDIDLEEKIHTAFLEFVVNSTETTYSIDASQMKQYVFDYWGEMIDYSDFSFTIENYIYTYLEEEKRYQIQITSDTSICAFDSYMNRYKVIPIDISQGENQIFIDHVIIYYIEDTSSTETIYHIYQDREFTKYLTSISQEDFINIAKNEQENLEHYTFIFEKRNEKYYFYEGKKTKNISSLLETDIGFDLARLHYPIASIEQGCPNFENNKYQKNMFTLEDISIEERLYTIFYFAHSNNILTQPKTIRENGISYSFLDEEIKTLYQEYWGIDTEFVLQDFQIANYEGRKEGSTYIVTIFEFANECNEPIQYVETKWDKTYQDGDLLYIDYKIRFIQQKFNLGVIVSDLYQDRNTITLLKSNISESNLSQLYWDLKYITYRYVFKKHSDGNYYFVKGLYI